MRALVSAQVGPPEALALRDVPAPVPGPGEVRIRVEACGINYPDLLMIEDRYQFPAPRPFVPGIEIAGTVEAIGPAVERLAPGMRVAAQIERGGLAEQAVAPAAATYALPDGVGLRTGAATLLTYATSHHALRDRAGLRAGETLLVLGAAGGVGLAAIDLARAAGARIVAAVSSEAKAATARAAGADEVLIYPAAASDPRAFGEALRAAAPAGFDVVYDPVGGDYAEPAVRRMAWGGRYLVVGFAAGIPRVPLNLVLLKGCAITGVFWGAHAARDPAAAQALVAELFAMMADGRLTPRPPQLFPLARGGEAIAALRDRTAVGKLVVTP